MINSLSIICMLNTDLLEFNWLDLIAKFNVDSQLSKTIFVDLSQTYSNKTRHYHNLNHIQHLLNLIEEVKAIADSLSVIQLAAWFHDYVYHPQAKDNEVKSAIYAEQTLNNLNIAPDIIQSVKQIILSTQKHQPLIDSIDNLIFLDVDLAILGTSPSLYAKYAQAIRQEYSWLSDRNYQQGRKAILTNFLSKERIYYTDYFYRQLELTARANLTAEISLYV